MVVHFSDDHWPTLQHSVGRLLHDMQGVLTSQPLTRTWTVHEIHQAERLIAALRSDWETHCVQQQTVWEMEQLSGRLDAAACTVIRANVGAIRQHLIYILHDTAAALDFSGLSRRESRV
ncbi:hypothetical protein GCM10010841_25700 [Deinococcus aerophilus]|uniref:Uncharacterized protein n=1 Tax=Deinococcus aerophilus TaxID=522488 RepID=A0ABQ2GW25_9DEIO|nr:hypothetical protein GCM10010841_25700 [Deinococcus aerophilus]